MKKKIIAVFACVLSLTCLCTVFAVAEETGSEEMVWDLWSLLKPENLDLIQLFMIFVTTIVTFVRMFSGGDFKDLWQKLIESLKSIIPSK